MPCSLLRICCCMPYSLLFVAACRAVCYLLPHSVEFAICCRMSCSLLQYLLPLFVTTCCIVQCCYLSPHAMQFATCCFMPYSCWFLLHTLQLLFVAACCAAAICCCMPCSLVFVADCCTVCYVLLYMPCNFVFITACCAVCYLLAHAMQLAICCCTLYSLSFIAIPTAQHNLGEIGHSKNCLIISNTNNRNSLSDKVHCHKQVDVLPSKNQAFCCKLNLLIYCLSMIVRASREQRLITKEHIATHTNLFFGLTCSILRLL